MRKSPPRAAIAWPCFAALAAVVACSGNGGGPSPVPRTSPSAVPSGSAAPTASPTAPAAAQMSVPLTLGTTTGNPGPRILVALPSASPFSMLFDTGSTGLRILPSALAGVPASSYTNTGTHTAEVFGGTRVYYGTTGVAAAGVTIGGTLKIAKPLNFQIVDTVCQGNIPSPLPLTPPADCDDVTAQAEKDVVGGIIGVRPGAENAVLNPLAELPAPYSDGFVVSAYGSAPTLTVGTTAANQSGFQTYEVGAATAMDGSPYWQGNAILPWCYQVTVAGSAPVSGCPSPGALTDSGGDNERITLTAAPPASLAPNASETLPPGSTVVATLTAATSTVPGITWTLTTGSCTYYDAPQVYFAETSPSPAPSSSPPGTSNALAPFFTNDVLFDLRGGTFGFRAVSAAAPAICS